MADNTRNSSFILRELSSVFPIDLSSGNYVVTTRGTTVDPDAEGPITWDDATWILTSSFIIFTMQSGTFFYFLKYGMSTFF